jgi:peptidoglycan/xylan/chitin deacetylase (PgdA/CDA1 family)
MALGQLLPSVASLGQWLPVRRVGRCAWRGAAHGPPGRVALTFDDGPCPDSTPALLDRLDELGVRATFFPSGAAVARHAAVAGEVVSRGHQVETHGYHHRHHLWSSPWWIGADLDAALAVMAGVGVCPRWLRPPYGQVSTGTVLAARRRGLGLAMWSAWGREWVATDARAVARRVGAALSPGAVVLLHDSDEFSPAGSARRAHDAVGFLVDELARRGMIPVTLDEVVQ